MDPSLRKAGMATLVKAGETMEKLREQGPAITGGIHQKELALWAGTATVTALALDAGVNQAGPILAAVTPGSAAEDQILQIRVLQILAPTGVNQLTSPIL